MAQCLKSAIIAEPSQAEAARVADALRSLNFSRIDATDDGLKALKLVDERQPDALVISSTLRPSDGVWLARAVLARSLRVRPSIVITRVAGLWIPGEKALADHGVAVISRPTAKSALVEALRQTDVSVRKLPETVARRRGELFQSLGVPDHEGRKYLECAVGYAYQDMRLLRALTAALYPMVAKRHGVSARKVEQSMRYAIELAWKHGRIDEQYRIFRGTIDAQRGKPTCGEMIAQLADILRMEEVRG
jgi:two-component system response regulator (stage 0 sporulation protein A)